MKESHSIIQAYDLARTVLRDPSRPLEELEKVWEIAENLFRSEDFPQVKVQNTFFIGFNKTGTTSIHETLSQAGFKSVHNPSWTWRTYSPLKIIALKNSQMYSDGECPFFPGLMKTFPDSNLIYQSRDWRPWLLSRCVHVESNKRRNGRTDWIDNSPESIRVWIDRRLWFENKVRSFPTIKRISLGDTSWLNTISESVGVSLKEVRANVRKHRNHSKLKQFTEIIDEILYDYGLKD